MRDPAIMLYTSGTTANPKGCPISHEAIVRNSIALGRYRYQLRQEDRFWSPLPMFHIAAILPMVAIFDVAGAYLTMSYFDAGVALKMLEEEQATATYPCFVTIMSDLIHHPDFPRTDLSRIRLMNSNFRRAAARHQGRDARGHARHGLRGHLRNDGNRRHRVHERADRQPGSPVHAPGHAAAGLEVKIVDIDSGEPAPTGAQGEILVRGYSLFDGYYKDPGQNGRGFR